MRPALAACRARQRPQPPPPGGGLRLATGLTGRPGGCTMRGNQRRDLREQDAPGKPAVTALTRLFT